MRRLFPVTDQTPSAEVPGPGPAVDREWTFDELADAYAYPASVRGAAGAGTAVGSGAGTAVDSGAVVEPAAGGRPWLRANMVSTLDGAAQYDGLSQPISSAADMRIFGTLRGLADVVVVGAETVRLEQYRPARPRQAFAARRAAAGQAPAPAIAVVSAGLNLDFSLPLFSEPLVPTLLVTGAEAPADRIRAAEKAGVEVLIAGEGPGADPARTVRVLAERGFVRLLTEGGPRLLGQFVAAGVLDELCLTLSPALTAGPAQRIAAGLGPAVPERFVLVSLLEQDGFLFARYRRA
ncbi:pyrimidine reductase family protein [Streptomyces sp. GMY02]|uniref:pyrimidine reductase family protein n=1 Tax=Streptomyces sp. GMY02 TaxID=1333528 RepID=UPI001C2C4780|nr:pyrimidine reductase family protein [Streptomyces sp. GMY02]QXE34152.1 pyrimidine reductase family protein [Streptomyces sp. GMY02]